MKTIVFLPFILLIIPLMGRNVLGGKFYTTKRGIKYYVEHLYQYTWFEAYFECIYRNMSLYTYGSQGEFDDLYELLTSDKFSMKPHDFWIGAIGVKGKFMWIKNHKPMTALHLWSDNNPDNTEGKENCLNIWHAKKYLNDLNCLRTIGFVCETNNEKEVEENVTTGKYKGLTINLYQNNIH
ncbi:lectin subunit alpha-like [Musca autumnalis]|uniref:lectin subunit alpha-like n=1 Tax=Musca autumnalis TaxID=221902 RepID=UPI003CF920D4